MMRACFLLYLHIYICKYREDNDIRGKVHETNVGQNGLILPVDSLAKLHCSEDNGDIRYHSRHVEITIEEKTLLSAIAIL